MMIYLDANASEPMRPQAVRAVFETLQETGNPASVHAAGRSARRLLETSRATIAQCLGGRPATLYLLLAAPKPTTWPFRRLEPADR